MQKVMVQEDSIQIQNRHCLRNNRLGGVILHDYNEKWFEEILHDRRDG
jgi:hypothetical protein